MNMPPDLQQELPDHTLESFPAVPGAYVYRDQTPAHSFVTVIAPASDTQWFLALTARDFFDEALAANIVDFVRSRWQSVSPERSIFIIEGFHYAGYDFDSVAVLSPKCGNIFEHENQELSLRTFVSFPIFRCEFSGQETCDLIDMIRHDFVSTLNWKRRVSPQVYVRFRNNRTGVGSTGKKLGLTSTDILFEQLHDLTGDNSSFIDVKNYKGELCHITREDNYVISLPPSQKIVSVPANEIDSWVSTYLTKGLSAHRV
jgi:hypothetical protein